MSKEYPDRESSTGETTISPVASPRLNSPLSTKFREAAREDYLYSYHSDDAFYYEQRPPHWGN